jgi:hypothetical protein
LKSAGADRIAVHRAGTSFVSRDKPPGLSVRERCAFRVGSQAGRPADLPAMANQIFALGCGKSTRRANHF